MSQPGPGPDGGGPGRLDPGPSAAAEQAVKGAPDLLGQRGVAHGPPSATGTSSGPPDPAGSGLLVRVLRAGERRDQDRGGLADQAAVQALDLAQPADQVHAARSEERRVGK